jgi:hypothetical protein
MEKVGIAVPKLGIATEELGIAIPKLGMEMGKHGIAKPVSTRTRCKRSEPRDIRVRAGRTQGSRWD